MVCYAWKPTSNHIKTANNQLNPEYWTDENLPAEMNCLSNFSLSAQENCGAFLGYCGGNHKSHITRASKTLTGPFDATATDLEYISGETCTYFKQTYEH